MVHLFRSGKFRGSILGEIGPKEFLRLGQGDVKVGKRLYLNLKAAGARVE
jgi:hypothetical protein